MLYIPVLIGPILPGPLLPDPILAFESHHTIIHEPSMQSFFSNAPVVLHNIVAALLGIWILIVTTRAVKRINVFGTAKALGIVAAATVVSGEVVALLHTGIIIIPNTYV